MHGSNRLGGNSLSDLLVFGRRAGVGAAEYLAALGDSRPAIQDADVDAAAETALAPFRDASENPYTLHQELQQKMNDLVGIIRTADELELSLKEIEALKERAEAADGRPSRAEPSASVAPASSVRRAALLMCFIEMFSGMMDGNERKPTQDKCQITRCLQKIWH